GVPGLAIAPLPTPVSPPVLGHLFWPISTEDEEQHPTQIESLCMNCYGNGMTQIIVSSFSCHHCGWNNTEIQSAGRIQDQGVRYTWTFRVLEMKTDSATTRIPELDFQIPAFSQKGARSTVEGLITHATSGLERDQPARRANKDDTAERIDEFVVKLEDLPFTVITDDPSGNSSVENPRAAQKDDALQEEMLGLQKPEEEDLRNEVLQFNTNVQIPPFKEVIIMATNCKNCRHQTNEVKSGEAVEPLGTRITLHITGPSDMTRDLLKSEVCSFTTLEGPLKDIWELVTKNPFTLGGSSNPGQTERLQEFSQKMDQIIEGNMKTHFIMDDPNVYAPEDDPEMKVEHYKCTSDQNEELRLSDIKTEGYEAGLAPQQ
uniref:Zinc finger ZPR1-type domain-containing protein n=1 Tax=Rhinopithecus roxellana TaxID=61622 RepID=A0A2K6NHL5_RHIRO